MVKRLGIQDLFVVLLIAGCVAASVGLFFILRAPDESNRDVPPEVPAAERGAMKPSEKPVISPPNRERGEAGTPVAGTEVELASAVLKDLLRKIVNRRTSELTVLLEGAVDDRAALRRFTRAVEEGRLVVDVDHPLSEVTADTEGALRWNVHLIRQPDGRPERLGVMLERSGDLAWILKRVALPEWPETEVEVAGKPAEDEGSENGALKTAQGFLEAMAGRDFARARSLAESGGVPNEKLAALGIVLEEGAFQPAPDSPFLTTSIMEDRAWILARVASETFGMQAEFGLEMAKNADGSWVVEGVNLSSLMKEFVRADKSGESFQEPLVELPQGGESIALYFGYDVDELSARSLRQLGIVAEILRATPKRQITIAGHADALGDETYNDSLSQRRARRVAEALRNMGVPASQISTKSFGEAVPLRPNTLPDGSDNPEGRKRNRRTELYLNF